MVRFSHGDTKRLREWEGADMATDPKIVARFKTSKVIKGYMMGFTGDTRAVVLEDPSNGTKNSIPVDDLKALFFVKSFEGSSAYRERKRYGIRENLGRKVYLKFYDGESLVGFLEQRIDPEKIISFTKSDPSTKGFYMIPVDSECNNDRVFAVWNAIQDVTTFP